MKKILAIVFGLFITITPVNAFACVGGEEGLDANCTETTETKQEEQSRFDTGTKLTTSGEVKKSSFFAGNEIIDETKINGLAFMAGNDLTSMVNTSMVSLLVTESRSTANTKEIYLRSATT